ncbi:MAG: DUF2442 domain-containing protein [Bryobacteraceae bacterium]
MRDTHWVTFANGASGNVDLSSRLFGPVFEPLRDPALFSQARVDEYGAVCWPNGADLAGLYKLSAKPWISLVKRMSCVEYLV